MTKIDLFKRFVSSAAAGALCLGALTACGSSGSKSSKSNSSKKSSSKSSSKSAELDGDYINLMRIDGHSPDLFIDDPDDAVKDTLKFAEELADDSGDPFYSTYRIRFDDGDFELSQQNLGTSGAVTVYSGTYSVKNRKIYFGYENRIDRTVYDDEETVYNINDDPGDSRAAKAVIETMGSLNNTGSYPTCFMPSPCASDKLSTYAFMPLIYRRGEGTLDAELRQYYLIAAGDLLVQETYGLELDGTYKKGKDFVLEFDQLDAFIDDPCSRYSISDEDRQEELYDNLIDRLEMNYGTEKTSTTIEFSDGRWEWLNAEGDLINNGEYKESSDYPGLIAMYATEDSLVNVQGVTSLTLLYLADNGEVYYPCFVKVK